MRTHQTTKPKRGFTLIEILIVVVILGILAAIVIPQFAESADGANESAAKSTLQTVRAQYELCRFKGECACDDDVADLIGTTASPGTLVTGGYLQAVPNLPGTFDWDEETVNGCTRILIDGQDW